jgi:sugar/nucleoside kinase (ribokinase family)
VIGHVTLDRVGDATRPGGGALYAAITAHRLGLSVGLLTSHAADFPLDAIPSQVEVVTVDARETTRFEHRYEGAGRVSHVRGRASPLGAAHVPDDWLDAPLVLLAPVLDEVDPLLAVEFAEGAVGAAGQGWLRAVGRDGLVAPRTWESPRPLLNRIQTLFLSREDVRGQEASVVEWLQYVPIGALTADRDGALLFVNGDRYEVRARPAKEVDPTGAGDVFATTFLVEYDRSGDPWHAGAAAACAGSLTVEGDGWSMVPERAALDAAIAEYRRAD